MVEQKIVRHSEVKPVYTNGSRTAFLDDFCSQNDIKIDDLIGEAADFTNYDVSYRGDNNYVLVHYHGDLEEYIFLNYSPKFNVINPFIVNGSDSK